MTLLLTDKNAVIYGAGGGIGRGVAHAFAREGARLFLVGRTAAPLEALAADLRAGGSEATVAVLDALDEAAVTEHLAGMVATAGSVDISFNLVSRGDVQGVPLLDLTADDLLAPVTTGLRTTFVTARAAARHMVGQGSGVILGLTSGSARGLAPMMGGTGPADAAVETFLRYLAAEVGPAGVRVLSIYTAGVPETLTVEKLAAVSEHAPAPEEVERMLSAATMLKRAPRLHQVADVAAFLASDRAAGMTATIANVTCGLVT